MIARTWHGAVSAGRSDHYLHQLCVVGLGDYKNTPGNRGAYALRRSERDVTHLVLLSFWESVESIKAYAGDDISVPRYTAFDPDYLIELEPTVTHHSVFGGAHLDASDGVGSVARMWHGGVPLEKADAYLNLMQRVALNDYRGTSGNRGAFVLHRIADEVAHFTMLTFWDSRDAIKGFAGDSIEVAKYYDFDRHFLIELEPTVLHYDVFEKR